MKNIVITTTFYQYDDSEWWSSHAISRIGHRRELPKGIVPGLAEPKLPRIKEPPNGPRAKFTGADPEPPRRPEQGRAQSRRSHPAQPAAGDPFQHCRPRPGGVGQRADGQPFLPFVRCRRLSRTQAATGPEPG